MWVLALLEFPAVVECNYWIPSAIDVLCILFFFVNLFLHLKATGSILTLEDYFRGHGLQFALQALVIALLIIDLGLSVAHPGQARVNMSQCEVCIRPSVVIASVVPICMQHCIYILSYCVFLAIGDADSNMNMSEGLCLRYI